MCHVKIGYTVTHVFLVTLTLVTVGDIDLQFYPSTFLIYQLHLFQLNSKKG